MVINFETNQVFKVVTYLGTFLGGIAVSFGQGWVQDFFKKKQENRLNVEKFMAKVTDVVASSTASGYTDYPTGAVKARLVKSSAHLERYGQLDMAKTVRDYMNKWSTYNNLILTSIGTPKNLYGDDLKFSIKLKDELDKLTDKILSKS